MKYAVLLLISSLGSFISPIYIYSQPNDCGCHYQANKFIAYRQSAQGKPDSALFYFKAAFSTGHAALRDLLMAADRAILTDSLSDARRFIIDAFGRGLTAEGHSQFLKWSGRGKIDENKWISQDTIDQIVSRYHNRLNQRLFNKLIKMQYNDQRFRNDDDMPSPGQLATQDSINAADLKKIVLELGHLPGYSEVGSEGVDILELLFLHMTLENLSWFLPYIIHQVHSCEYFDTDGLAYQIDRIAISSGMALYINEKNSLSYDTLMPIFLNKQYFSVTGYWYDTNPSDGVNYFWPVFSPIREMHLKNTRDRLCLDSYEHYVQRNPHIKSVSVSELKRFIGG